ncbi:MAG: hypothetical protein EXR72_14475 [Myxococcales bacterium]|nr:hypothetical protein [Myxococcales bacterium]
MKRATLALMACATACGQYNFTAIPVCEDGQVLTGNGSALKCVAQTAIGPQPTTDAGMKPPAGSPDMAMAMVPPADMTMGMVVPGLMVPACGPGRCLTGENNGTLSCIDVTMTNQTVINLVNDVTALTNKLNALQKQVDNLGKGKAATYVGVTPDDTNGRIIHANVDVGIASATAYCVDKYGAGAHMCTTYEMYMTVASGIANANMTIPKSWVYAPAWQNPLQGSQQPLGGHGDNCASYTYPTSDRKWSGVAVEWNMNPQKDASALWWQGGTNALCNQKLPIACCK